MGSSPFFFIRCWCCWFFLSFLFFFTRWAFSARYTIYQVQYRDSTDINKIVRPIPSLPFPFFLRSKLKPAPAPHRARSSNSQYACTHAYTLGSVTWGLLLSPTAARGAMRCGRTTICLYCTVVQRARIRFFVLSTRVFFL